MTKTKPSRTASDMVPVPREIVVLVASLLLGAAGGGGADYLNSPDDGLASRVAAVESRCDALPAVERRLGAVEHTSTNTHRLVGEVHDLIDWAHPRER